MRDIDTTRRYLRRIADVDRISGDDLMAVRAHQIEAHGESPLTEHSIETWENFKAGTDLTPAAIAHMEAIVVPNGLRPAFDVANDSFADLPDLWSPVNAHRSFVERCIRGIGRINIPGHALLEYAGTGFVVGPQLLLTNRHVANDFCETGGGQLSFTLGIQPSVDFKQEVASAATVQLSITAPILILNNWDAALFQVDAFPAGVLVLPLSSTDLNDGSGKLAAIVGYPALDATASAQEILQQIQLFRAVFNKKRLQPGRLTGRKSVESFGQNVSALAHDCTTLGGNSGSALLDVDDERVVGLHFGGDYLVANYAVPSWELAADARMKAAGVVFQ